MTRPITLSIPLQTIENPSYFIPPGTYELQLTYSPRFKKPMPLVCNVPATPAYPSADGRTTGSRSGIRLHLGTREEHSQGCILVNSTDLTLITQLLQSHEKVTITIHPDAPSV